jgi:hypothetical protein
MTGKGHNEAIKAQLLSLVTQLPASSVRDLLGTIGLDTKPGSERLALVRLTFIEYLNDLRPHRARRLFTDLFGPLLVTDGTLLRTRKPIPGLILRVDAGALWKGLSRYGFPELVVEVQQTLDRMAETTLLEQVLRSAEAQALRERMRKAAVSYLNGLLAREADLANFLTYVNQRREAESRKRTLYLNTIGALERPFIQFVRDWLANADACLGWLGAEVARIGRNGPGENEIERATQELVQACDDLLERGLKGNPRSELPLIVPLILINARQRYDIAAAYLRGTSPPEAVRELIGDTLLGHLACTGAAMVEILSGALKLKERIAGASVKFTLKEKNELRALLDRIDRLLSAMVVAGVLENRHTEPAFRLIWQDLTRFLSDRVSLIATQRAMVVMTTRAQAIIDHADVLWLVRLLWDWHQLGRVYDLSSGHFDRWRDQVIEDCGIAIDRAARVEEGETLAERMHHLLRLNELLMIFDRRITQFLSVSSVNLLRMVTLLLQRTEPLTANEQILVQDVLAMARAELARSRNWRSPELQDLIELADQQRLTAGPRPG